MRIYRGQSSFGRHEWMYGYLVFINDKPYITPSYWDGKEVGQYEVIPETVGQWSGLKDKLDKFIYEGDIVERNDNMGYKVVGSVLFQKGRFGLSYNSFGKRFAAFDDTEQINDGHSTMNIEFKYRKLGDKYNKKSLGRHKIEQL